MAFCSKCGVKLEEDVRFCSSCGNQTGYAGIVTNQQNSGNKNLTVALLLLLFTGCGHRFYAGKAGTAVLMLILLILVYVGIGLIEAEENEVGLLFMAIGFIPWIIWWIIDLVGICNRRFSDKYGNPITKWQ